MYFFSPPTSTPPTTSTSCSPIDCLEGESFNTTSCKCGPATPAPPTVKTTDNATAAPTECVEVACRPGQAFHKQSCKCLCRLIIQCPGYTVFDHDRCTCVCRSVSFCRPNVEYFDHYLCTCMPLYQQPNRFPPILFPQVFPTTPPTAPVPNSRPPQTTRCPPTAVNSCHSHQQMDPVSCQCYCPANAAQKCLEPKKLNTSSCQCVCPSLLSQSCGQSQYFDHNDCQCKCRRSFGTCSQLQQFNASTCQCQCKHVIVLMQVQYPITPINYQPYSPLFNNRPGARRGKRQIFLPAGPTRTRGTRLVTSVGTIPFRTGPGRRFGTRRTFGRTRGTRLITSGGIIPFRTGPGRTFRTFGTRRTFRTFGRTRGTRIVTLGGTIPSTIPSVPSGIPSFITFGRGRTRGRTGRIRIVTSGGTIPFTPRAFTRRAFTRRAFTRRGRGRTGRFGGIRIVTSGGTIPSTVPGLPSTTPSPPSTPVPSQFFFLPRTRTRGTRRNSFFGSFPFFLPPGFTQPATLPPGSFTLPPGFTNGLFPFTLFPGSIPFQRRRRRRSGVNSNRNKPSLTFEDMEKRKDNVYDGKEENNDHFMTERSKRRTRSRNRSRDRSRGGTRRQTQVPFYQQPTVLTERRVLPAPCPRGLFLSVQTCECY